MRWFTNLRTQTKFLLAFAMLVLVGAVVIGLAIYGVVYMENDVQLLKQQVDDLASLKAVQSAFEGQQLALRDYLLTADPNTLQDYDTYSEQIVQYLQRALQEAGSTEGRNDLQRLDQYRQAYEEAFGQIVAVADSGNAQQAIELAGEMDRQEARQLQDQLNGLIQEREIDLQDLIQLYSRQVRETIFFGVIALFIFSLLTITAAIIGNQITEPILHLTNAVVAFQSNAFRPSLLQPYLKRRDEMGQLARALDDMVRFITESVQTKDRLLGSAMRFVPHQYLDFLEKDSIVQVSLGDHISAEMVVMFSDIRSFTTFSERMSPQANFDFVNTYLQLVSPIVQENDGFVVKFLGDGIMAIFPYGADDAVRTGIEKQRQVERLNTDRAQQGQPPVQVGIGIHTGHMMVGMIGEENRIQGDAFSDTVNLTSRVEGLTKFYKVSLIITEEVRMRLEQPIPYELRFLGRVLVKGRTRPIVVYEVLDGDPEELRARKLAIRPDFEQGLEHYIGGRFAQARECFARVQQQLPEDGATAMYLEKLAGLIDQEAPADWDGVEVMAEK